MMSNKAYTILTVIIAILCGIFLFVGHQSESSSAQAKSNADRHLRTERIAYRDRDNQLISQLFAHADESKDLIIKSTAINIEDNKAVDKPVDRFFSTYYNWDNSSDYRSRAKEESNLATRAVTDNQRYFDKDKDSSGESIVDNEELHSKYDNADAYIIGKKGNQLNILTNVQYEAHQGNDESKIGQSYFKMQYDTKSRKFTGMNEIWNDNNIEDNQIGDESND